MHPIELFKKKKFRNSIPLNPLAMKLNSAVYAPYERQRKRDVLQYLPLSKKLPPPPLFEHRFVTPPPPPPPDNDRVCDHNALQAFSQEKISHYTTEWTHEILCTKNTTTLKYEHS